jgi:hypothetical protein
MKGDIIYIISAVMIIAGIFGLAYRHYKGTKGVEQKIASAASVFFSGESSEQSELRGYETASEGRISISEID